jgi:hypothetical protein
MVQKQDPSRRILKNLCPLFCHHRRQHDTQSLPSTRSLLRQSCPTWFTSIQMEMRWFVLVKEHPYDNSKEPANLWHGSPFHLLSTPLSNPFPRIRLKILNGVMLFSFCLQPGWTEPIPRAMEFQPPSPAHIHIFDQRSSRQFSLVQATLQFMPFAVIFDKIEAGIDILVSSKLWILSYEIFDPRPIFHRIPPMKIEMVRKTKASRLQLGGRRRTTKPPLSGVRTGALV